MNKQLIQVFIFLILSIKGFSQEKLTITIDSACCPSNEAMALEGTFALYGDKRIPAHPFWVKDTLLKILEFKKEQVLNLEYMPYTIRFIPNDSSDQAHSLGIHPSIDHVNLSCFFFNKSYPLTLRTMKNNDYIKIVSQYAGPTNMSTAIAIHSLVLVKKRGSYYASYAQSSTDEQGIRFMNIQTQAAKNEKIKIDESYVKLTDEQLKTIEAFWNNMDRYWRDGDASGSFILSNTGIEDKNGSFMFKSKRFVSELLWNELN